MSKPIKANLVGKGVCQLPEWILRGASRITELELSDNKLTDINFLRDFPNLTALVLDRNLIKSHSVFPYSETLHLLWLNFNQIDNMTFFVDRLSTSLPNLTWLSLMMNPGTPGLSLEKCETRRGKVKGMRPTVSSSKFEIHDYRCYVATRFPKLKMLDDAPITEMERKEGARLYGKICPPGEEFFGGLSLTTSEDNAYPVF